MSVMRIFVFHALIVAQNASRKSLKRRLILIDFHLNALI